MLERALAALVAVPFLLGAAAVPVDHAQKVFTFKDGDITESSGLVVVRGLVATTNDSGDRGRVFSVDPATGETVGVTGWGNDPVDVEALAPDGDHAVWAGDIGDNTETRDTIQVSPVPVGEGNKNVDAPIYDLVYPDGPHNAETLMTDPTTGRLYIATKGVLGGTLYAAPAKLSVDHPNQLEPLGDVLPIATDGTFLPDGKHFVVRNYAVAAVYAFPSLEKVDQFRLPGQPQGEGIAVDADGTLLLSSEGVHTAVLRIGLPTTPSSGATPTVGPTATPTASPTPHTESREDSELPSATQTQRSAWPWLLSGLVGLGVILVLLRSLRRR
jgi:hypothetical protein